MGAVEKKENQKNLVLKGFNANQLKELRQKLEKTAIQSPHAYSTDGKIFNYEAPLSLPLSIGSYIIINAEGGTQYFGQVITQNGSTKDGPEYGVEVNADTGVSFILKATGSAHFKDRIKIRFIEGHGILLGKVKKSVFTKTSFKDTFHDAEIFRASDELINIFLTSHKPDDDEAGLEIGRSLSSEGNVRGYLGAKGFNRHTFLCGQSGSGKTFALGVILEQLLIETDLRIVILDPNSDFVRLDQIRRITDINKTRSEKLLAEKYDHFADYFDKIKPSLRIMRPESCSDNSPDVLKIRLSDLAPNEQGAILSLDPLDEREEFNSFYKIVESLDPNNYLVLDIMNAIIKDFSSEARKIGLRIENLGIENWEIWCQPEDNSLTDLLKEDWRCLVLDIGSLSSTKEKLAISSAVFGYFWRNRNEKKPVLIVIDEAHNLCLQSPTSNLEKISTDHVIRIAGEGRKYGIYLLLSTQRPQKIHSNAITLCDNLVLMKMISNIDQKFISDIFSQASKSLISKSSTFSIGEALIAGNIVRSPTFAKFEGRLTFEGGSDVSSSWATHRKD